MRRLSLPLAAALLATPALAQGIPDVRSGIALPNAQGAAVEDATALLVNPAGLALVEGVEVSAGGFVRRRGDGPRSDLDASLAMQLADGVAMGLGAGLALRDGQDASWRTSLGLAAGSRVAAVGLAVHGLSSSQVGGDATWSLDAGAQLHPARWLGLGLGMERLGDPGSGPATARVGVSVRPLEEKLTLGVDARVVPGSTDLGDDAFTAALTVAPAAVARVELDGVAVSAGASFGNLGPGANGAPTVEVMASVELHGAHLGAAVLGGLDTLAAGDATISGGGARLRASSAAWKSLLPRSGRWLSMTIEGEGTLVEEKARNIVAELFDEEPAAETVLLALHNAADDASVDGVMLDIRGLSLGWGRLAELRAALVRLRTSGKKVVIHLDGGDDGEVFLASAADRIFLTPSGTLDLNGLRAERLYFGDTLAKLGVKAEAVAAGRYKSAPRQFTSNAPSDEELEVEAALLDGAFSALTSLVAEGRALTEAEVRALIDRGGLSAPEAVEAKLVDGLAYIDEMEERIEEMVGGPVALDVRFLDRAHRTVRWDPPPRVALIPVVGTIAMESGFSLLGDTTADAREIVAAIDRAARDDDVRAIVLRIDSPGGDALASDLMWRAVMRAREKKPVVASMGDVAASGGYYVAAAAHGIWAEPNTITGSIGVFGLLAQMQELADRVGLRVSRSDRGALTGPSIFEPLSAPQRAALQRSVDAAYERFLDAVLEGRGPDRGLGREALRDAAEGRVWTGTQALERKLVDALGGLMEALEDARERAGIPADEPVVLEVLTRGGGDLTRISGLARAFGARGPDDVKALARALLGDPSAWSAALACDGRPLALSPVRLRIRDGAR